MTKPTPPEDDSALKAVASFEKKLDALHNYMMTPKQEPKGFFTSTRRIVIAVLALFIVGLYFTTPHDSEKDRYFLLLFVLAGVLPVALFAWFSVWVISLVLRQPFAYRILKRALDDEVGVVVVDEKTKAQQDKAQAKENARYNGPIADDDTGKK